MRMKEQHITQFPVQGGTVLFKKSSKRRECLSHLYISPTGFLGFGLYCMKAIVNNDDQGQCKCLSLLGS